MQPNLETLGQELEQAKAIRGFIAQGFVQGPLAVNSVGKTCLSEDKDAIAWCLMGAFMRVVGVESVTNGSCKHFVNRLTSHTHGTFIGHWSEALGRTQDEVLGMLDGVIQEIEGEISSNGALDV